MRCLAGQFYGEEVGVLTVSRGRKDNCSSPRRAACRKKWKVRRHIVTFPVFVTISAALLFTSSAPRRPSIPSASVPSSVRLALRSSPRGGLLCFRAPSVYPFRVRHCAPLRSSVLSFFFRLFRPFRSVTSAALDALKIFFEFSRKKEGKRRIYSELVKQAVLRTADGGERGAAEGTRKRRNGGRWTRRRI